MTENDHILAVAIKDVLERELKNLVDLSLKNADINLETENLVRTMLSEQMRFWKE